MKQLDSSVMSAIHISFQSYQIIYVIFSYDDLLLDFTQIRVLLNISLYIIHRYLTAQMVTVYVTYHVLLFLRPALEQV